MNFLNFFYEMIWENFDLEEENIEILLNLFNGKNQEKGKEKEKDDNNKLIEAINIIIFKILIKITFINDLNLLFEKLNHKLENIINSENIFSIIASELAKVFNYLLINDKKAEREKVTNDNGNPMELFEKIFAFILNLFNKIIETDDNNYFDEKDKELRNIMKKENFVKLLNLLDGINELLIDDKILRKNNINCLYCLINFLIFYYLIIFFEKKVLLFSDVKFTEILIQLIYLLNEYFLLNCMQLFPFKILNLQYRKTVIEIIYELSTQYFLNEGISEKCFDILLKNCNFIFYDREYINNIGHSIFFSNDYLRYFMTKKNVKLKDNALQYKCDIIEKYNNELFIKEDKFQGNMVTYFLPIIIKTQNSIHKITNKTSYIQNLSIFLDELFSFMLKEHIDLYKLDKKYFFKSFTDNYSHNLSNYLKNNYIKNKNPPSMDEIKKNIEEISEQYTKDISEQINHIKENLDNHRIKQKQTNILEDIVIVQNDSNKNYNFYNLDKNYITNVKKEIMNCIFSYYYLDELFGSQDFCIVKKYYMNNYLNNKDNLDTKKLNFPSIIKNFRNNFEPPLFIKKFNNYIVDPYFPISHSYIENKVLNKKLTMEKSIKLYPKEFITSDNDKEFECELIKNEDIYYGKLYYNDSKNYLLFKQQENNFIEEEGFQHFFLLSNIVEKNNAKNEERKNFVKRKFFKNILILLDDIEEIIEIRILLLWKGIEIFLKNGKSYIFNFLTTKEYDIFMKKYLIKSKIKNLVRKRNFLSDKNIISKIWTLNLLSNFDYLLILNRYSSRSYNDPTQYPIFPWLLSDYKYLISFNNNEKDYIKIKNEFEKIKEESNKSIETQNKSTINKLIGNFQKDSPEIDKFSFENIIDIINKKNDKKKYNPQQFKESIEKALVKITSFQRNFKYTPSTQNEENRNKALKRYEGDINNGEKFPIHSGCHYSNIGFVYYYLMRQQPYDNLLIKIQDFILENPNRMFISINSIQKTLNLGFDNRELIPDLFSKIEIFLNLNCDLYGYNVNKGIVDDCEMKEIINDSKRNYYLSRYVNFIIHHKKLLNSALIGFHLRKWIDMIFGVNQLPPEKKRII